MADASVDQLMLQLLMLLDFPEKSQLEVLSHVLLADADATIQIAIIIHQHRIWNLKVCETKEFLFSSLFWLY